MKKRIILSVLISILTVLSVSTIAVAEPKTMPDGQIFDPEFYAQQNPDVVAAFGTDESALYLHYTTFGKNEGRLPYASATATVTASVPVTNDRVILDMDGGATKQAEIQKGYCDMPQNVKNFFNRMDLSIYACTKTFMKNRPDFNGRGTLGKTYLTVWDDGRIEGTIYVAGSDNSFMPARYTLYHELGHIVDLNRKYSSNWEGWTEMIPYSKTQVYSASEAFAEAFAGYLERPTKLKQIAPNAYAYIEPIVLGLK